jgi:site-specific DNA-methyltransferase (adenine-specific)
MTNKVFNEDCLTGMQHIPDKSVDMILCDLPYGTTACKWDVIIPFEPLWKQYERVIKDNGAIVLTASQPFTSALVMSNPKMFKYEWIWDKRVGSNFANAKYMPLKFHENIIIFYKKTPVYHSELIKTDKKSSPNKGKVFNSSLNCASSFKRHIYSETGYRQANSIITFNSQVGECNNINRIHPTQKPVALFEYLIKTYTNEGETVLDNCMGSGTTAIACINTGRNYIGFEKEEKYFNIIQERIKKHTVQLKLIA